MDEKFGNLTRKQIEIYFFHKQGKRQSEIAKTLGIKQPAISNTLHKVGKSIRDAKGTLDYIDILDNMDVMEMEFVTALELMKKRHEEKKLRDLSVQGTIKPLGIKDSNVVFTVGYEKRDVENFIKLLKINNIKILVDIRANGFSRKVGFSHRVLEKNLTSEDIDYLSLKELGAPKNLREGLKKKGYPWFFNEYKKYLENEKSELDKLEKIVKYTRSCLMCFELDPNECHRSMVSNELRERGFEVAHL
ncbi:MAG: DUF488 family protein [Candidatus Hydrothermarchaeales archaeon]